MAVKKNLLEGTISYKDLFDTQDALDTGILNSVTAGSITKSGRTAGTPFKNAEDYSNTTDITANKENFGSVLQGLNPDMGNALGAYKKRRLEQTNAARSGSGIAQSVLGGGAY